MFKPIVTNKNYIYVYGDQSWQPFPPKSDNNCYPNLTECIFNLHNYLRKIFVRETL